MEGLRDNRIEKEEGIGLTMTAKRKRKCRAIEEIGHLSKGTKVSLQLIAMNLMKMLMICQILKLIKSKLDHREEQVLKP